MKLPLGPADARALLRRSPEEIRDFLEKCGPRGVLLLDAAFDMWAHDGQLPPAGESWRVWLMLAGRGFGKTRAGAEWVNNLAQSAPKRIALVAASIDEARSVMVEGMSGILSVARKQRVRVKWEPSLGKLTWPKGTVARLYSGDHADGLRGPEHHVAWFDEVDSPTDASLQGYRLAVSGSLGAIERDCEEDQTIVTATELATLGPEALEISVRQIGALALSRPATIVINP